MANSFSPPLAVRNAARRGLRLRQLYSRGGLSTSEAGDAGIGSGVARARDLSTGRNVSRQTLERMAAFFSRHQRNYKPKARLADGGPTAGTIAWLLWGGEPGRRWVERELSRSEKQLRCEVAKTDGQLGIVFGYAIVCKDGDAEYIDVQDDHIPEDVMLRSAATFMEGERVAKDSHSGGTVGKVVFGYPLTKDLAKALSIEVQRTGMVVGMKPANPDILGKYISGEYTGFSIGGSVQSSSTM